MGKTPALHNKSEEELIMGRRHLFGWKSMDEGKTASDSILTAGDFYDCRRMQNPNPRCSRQLPFVPVQGFHCKSLYCL